jgi:hypothetical protein
MHGAIMGGRRSCSQAAGMRRHGRTDSLCGTHIHTDTQGHGGGTHPHRDYKRQEKGREREEGKSAGMQASSWPLQGFFQLAC